MSTPEKIQIRTPDGVADAWVHRPAGASTAPAVVHYPDAGGVRDVAQDMAKRLASLGYVVLLPNVLYRAGDFAPFDMKTVFTDPGERARLGGIIKQLDTASAVRDAGAYIDAALGLSGVVPGRVGCVGYCLGGRLAFLTAGAHADRVGGAASFHGGHLVTGAPDSPHLAISSIKAKLYLGVADNDASCTAENQGTLAAALAAAHVSYQLELYTGKGHGFAVPDLPTFDHAAAEHHWKRIEAFFAEAFPRAV